MIRARHLPQRVRWRCYLVAVCAALAPPASAAAQGAPDRAPAGLHAEAIRDRTLYFWSTTGQVATRTAIGIVSGSAPGHNPTLCRWDKSCMIQPGDAYARVRAVTGDAASSLTLFTLGQGGLPCITNKIKSGKETDVVAAYWECKPADANQAMLHFIG